MRFLWLDAQNLNAKERHFILPLVIWTFIMQSVAFITSISHARIKLISSTPINHTFLESNFFIACTDDNLLEGSYSMHRQVWCILMEKLVKGMFGSTSSISTWCDEFGQHEGERQAQPCWMIHDNILYLRYKKDITHYVVFLVQHQLLSMSYYNECSQLQKMSKIVYLYAKPLFLYYFLLIATMTNAMFVNP